MRNWDDRYGNQELLDRGPEPLLVRVADALVPGHALDLASGPGRHALFLASRGWTVTAVDASRVAIGVLRKRAEAHGLRVDARCADLEAGAFRIEPDSYDLICDFFYLQRDLFRHIRAGLRPGGLFVATMHMFNDAPDAKPMNPDFLLRSGELQAEFAGWSILHYAEGKEGGHRRQAAELVARRIT